MLYIYGTLSISQSDLCATSQLKAAQVVMITHRWKCTDMTENLKHDILTASMKLKLQDKKRCEDKSSAQ